MNIGIIIFLSLFGISLTFQIFIRKNIIKPSKISRIFYQDDERFINSWRKTQEKGILRYVINNIIFMTVTMGIIGIISTVYKPQNQTLFEYLSIGVILGLVISILWGDNQNRYNRLKENINNDNKKDKS